ncbi:hypothetical protein RUM43_007864 [Polyplax serrata]|uniref:Uncharacterized protein n=1 Tax=Polyplax serrata TaxID=468196 RepID=A0AAN8PN30_POLSC
MMERKFNFFFHERREELEKKGFSFERGEMSVAGVFRVGKDAVVVLSERQREGRPSHRPEEKKKPHEEWAKTPPSISQFGRRNL